MKKLYKTLLALAAVMTLGAVASAQDVPYLINDDHGLGYNKYLRTDNEGNRFIRIETFATGGGERKAIPADICLVLDNSGSMLSYYAKSGTESKYTMTMTESDILQYVASKGDSLLIPDRRYIKGNYTYSYSTEGSYGDGPASTSSSYKSFAGENGDLQPSFRYAKYNGKYYRIFQKQMAKHPVTGESGPWYFLCFRLDDADKTLMYLHHNAFVSSAPTDAIFKSNDKIIYDGDTPETVLWRAKTRREKLLEGVSAFIDSIYVNNQRIASDLETGKVGNQIAIVAFGGTSHSTVPYETPGATPISTTRIVKSFTPADNDTNVGLIKGGLDRMEFLGNTSIGYGMMLANEAFRLLRNNQPKMDAYEMEDDGVTYKTDSAGHPIVNRSKVVVVFTDGAPTAESAYTSIVDGHSVSNTTYAVRARAIDYSNLMKKTEAGNVNAKVFTVGLNASGASEAFLRHLSSNYPEATYTEDGTAASDYGPSTATSSLYYMDAGSQDLAEVFEVIASIAGGKSDVGGTSMVNIDIVSKSFQIPRGSASDDLASKIKVYTAQCLGLDPNKTYEEDGHIKHYLAFADSVEAGNRAPLEVLWTSAVNETTGEVTWTRETTVDVDGAISVTVEDDPTGQKDVIKVTGFDYAKMWCGLDGDANHADNTEQYNASEYGNFDARTGPYIKGYRGFKIIIDIPISLQNNAVGGPSVSTNEAGSGLLDPSTGTLLVPYPIPQLTIPVNLWIQKEGLLKNENATFTIQRKLAKPTDEVPDPQYEFFTTVNVTGDTNTNGTSKPVMVKLLNLDPAYYYKVVEQGWTWAYTSPAQTEATAPTTETILSNPIIIKNTPKPSTPKHDEAVKRNNM